MKVAIAASETLDSQASPVFGRCSHIIVMNIVDGDFKDVKAIPNPSTTEGGGAGIKTARIVGNENAQASYLDQLVPMLLSIKQLEIKTYQMVQGTVKENLTLMSQGKLDELHPTSSRTRFGNRGKRRTKIIFAFP